MYAAFTLVVLAFVWSVSDLGLTVEAKGFGSCKALVSRAIRLVNGVKRYKDDKLPTCKCNGKTISQIEFTDKDTNETTTLGLCTGCTGIHVPLKNSNNCRGCAHRRFKNFSPFCKTSVDQCNGKGVKIYTCQCKVNDGATTPNTVTDPETTAEDDSTTTVGGPLTTAGGVPPVDWMDY